MALTDDIKRFFDGLTKLPGQIATAGEEVNSPEIRRFGENLNEKVITLAQDVQNALKASGETVERNLTATKIETIGRNTATWLARPMNLILVAGGIVLLLFAVRKL